MGNMPWSSLPTRKTLALRSDFDLDSWKFGPRTLLFQGPGRSRMDQPVASLARLGW